MIRDGTLMVDRLAARCYEASWCAQLVPAAAAVPSRGRWYKLFIDTAGR